MVLGSFILLSLGSIFYIYAATHKPSTPILPAPPLKSPIKTEFAIESTISIESIDIPETLAIYTLSPEPLSATQMANIARKLEFSSQPLQLEDANYGTVYYWQQSAKSLRILPKNWLLDYQFPTDETVGGSFPDDETILQVAQLFLETTFLPEGSAVKYKAHNFVRLTPESEIIVPKTEADFVDVKFVEVVSGYPVVNETAQIGTIDIKMAKDKTILSAYLDALPKTLTQKNVKIKSFAELVASLANSKLMSLGEGIDLKSYSAKNIENVVVDRAKIAYYKAATQDSLLLQPIFVLEGSAQMADGNKTSALLYLPAVKD